MFLAMVILLLVISFAQKYYDKNVDILKRKTSKIVMQKMINAGLSPEELFKVWHLIHNKSYQINSDIGKQKEATFVKNYHFVKEHNQNYENNYTLGLNHFADLTQEEFHELFLKHSEKLYADLINKKGINNINNLNNKRFTLQATDTTTAEDHDDSKDFESINWTEKSKLSKVYQQGNCGSCWAFATTQAVEALYGIKNNASVSLSKQQLVDCEVSSNGCQGGDLHSAMEYIQTYGLETEKDYRYKESQSRCTFENEKQKYKIRGFDQCHKDTIFWIFNRDTSCSNDLTLYRTLKKGPVASVVDASNHFMLYEDGIFDKPCKNINHAILVMGYKKKEHEGDQNYWLVKNSWGPMWGNHGYIKIKQSDNYNSCLLNQYYVRPYL